MEGIIVYGKKEMADYIELWTMSLGKLGKNEGKTAEIREGFGSEERALKGV